MADMDTRGTWRALGKRPALVAATRADRGTFAFQVGPRPVARDEVIAFATAFDPQPIETGHFWPRFAFTFAGLSLLLTLASMRLVVPAGLGFRLRRRQPAVATEAEG